MSRYIDVVIAAEKISENHNIPLSELVDTFAEIPSADVVEVKRGEWIKLPSNGIGNTAECSVCHDSVYGYESCNFCPNCGADMRGDSK